MSDRDRARPPPSDRSRQRSRSRSGDRSDRRSDSRSHHGESGDQRDPRLDRRGDEGRSYSGGGGGYDRGGGGGNQDRGRGGYQRSSYQSSERGDDRGGDRGGYQGGGYEGRGGYDRGGSGGGGYQGRGGYDRSGGGGGRGGYQGGGGGYQGRGGYSGGGRGGGPGGGGGFRGPEPPARTEPEAIELYTNFFEVVTNPNWALYQYHVDFDPPQDSKRLKIGLFKPHEHLFGNNKAFDGMTLYSITKLDQPVTQVTSERKTDNLKIKLTIKLVNTINSCSSETMRMFNIIFKRCLKRANFKEFGRDRAYYDFDQTHNLNKYHLRVAAGYKASMDIYNSKIFLCTELAHKLINDMTVWNVIEDIFQKSGNEGGKAACLDYLVGQTVMTNYNKRSYRIDDIDWNLKPTDRFTTKNGEITYIDYYKNHYQIRIRNEHQPLLVSLPKQKDQRAGQKGPILLIPEFCSLTGNVLLKEFARDFAMKKDLDAITKLNPDVRYNRLNEFLTKIKNNPDARTDFNNWQMKLSDDMVKVNATILPNITVVFQGNSISNTERGWDKAIRNSTHLTSIPLTNWIILFMPRDQNKAEAFNNEICEISRAMNFRVERANLCRLSDSRGSNAIIFLNGIKEKVSQFKPQIVVCIVPSTNKDIYDSIKQTCCLDFGLPSQVVTSNIINMQNMNKTKSVVTKIALQMNCKLGGEIWGVTIPMKNIMIVGMDIYKDSSKKNMSVAAFVATTNGIQENKLNCTKYFSKCVLQQKGQEFSDNLENFMRDALAKFGEKNGLLPDRIFVYRDGVSDGQFAGVADYEVPQMRNAFKKLNENYNPKLTVLVVKKRGNTRFFFKGNRNEFSNAPMGTVIDNTIVRNPGSEFYLVSQSANQGTVSPTHFHIVAGEKELQPDRMQNLTFRLTHMYYNWPGQIRVPAPCHYAQKLAHLVGESLHQPQHPSLDELLFYL